MSRLVSLINAAAITYAPFAVVYQASRLKEDRAWRNCAYTLLCFVGTNLAKLILGSVFLPSMEGTCFSFAEEFVYMVLAICDFVGIYFGLRFTGSIEVKVWAVGWAWALATTVVHTIAPIWMCLRSLEFDPSVLFRGVQASIDMLICSAVSVYVWLLVWKWKKRTPTRIAQSAVTAVVYVVFPSLAKFLRSVVGAPQWAVLALQLACYLPPFLLAHGTFHAAMAKKH
eukprot:gnl/Trimastix_PCT/2228.p2 GENE.gnl/Trimastix_PCT/2228~~gnl/Trimastix_PCT/2228.p2  ORF type:complete len:227 (+),score=49.69 gnl/Trimastix_PCT/2228:66-746(+)